MSTIPGLHVLGEANFSDHGANRLGASALMQGLADGYFVIPYTIGHYLATQYRGPVSTDHREFAQVEAEVRERQRKLLEISSHSSGAGKGERHSVDYFHRKLGKLMWDECGMTRNAKGLERALAEIPNLREQFWQRAYVPGGASELNPWLEKAGRVADFLEFAELMCHDALYRDESCGGHFREEHQSPEGEALRDDERFAHVGVWEYKGVGQKPALHKEQLEFDYVKLTTRSYK
jgi:succinate dehydrogenase / fumarate reductase flavoprotein subunit